MSDPMRRMCVRGSCDAQLSRREASRGTRLCRVCTGSVAGHLSKLPGLYLACEQALEFRRNHPVIRVTARRPSGICLDEPVLRVRGDMINVLASWCELVVDERGVAAPGGLDIRLLASFLDANLDWLAAHAAAADFAEEVTGLVTAVGDTLNPELGRIIELGPCVEHGCSRTVRAVVRTSGDSSAHEVGCDAGHTWQPHQWLQLRRELSWHSQPPRREVRT